LLYQVTAPVAHSRDSETPGDRLRVVTRDRRPIRACTLLERRFPKRFPFGGSPSSMIGGGVMSALLTAAAIMPSSIGLFVCSS